MRRHSGSPTPQEGIQPAAVIGGMRHAAAVCAVVVIAGCSSTIGGQGSGATTTAANHGATASASPPAGPDQGPGTVAPQAGGPQIPPGVYSCLVDSSSGMGGESSPGYNLVIGAGNRYQSSRATDEPGTMVFSDDTNFVFVGGFLDGDPGRYTPGTIDYHTPDRSALFGCYP